MVQYQEERKKYKESTVAADLCEINVLKIPSEGGEILTYFRDFNLLISNFKSINDK